MTNYEIDIVDSAKQDEIVPVAQYNSVSVIEPVRVDLNNILQELVETDEQPIISYQTLVSVTFALEGGSPTQVVRSKVIGEPRPTTIENTDQAAIQVIVSELKSSVEDEYL